MFIDAENHIVRSESAAEKLIGSPVAAKAISAAVKTNPRIVGYPKASNQSRVVWAPEIQLFWDYHLLSSGGMLSASDLQVRISRAIYACSVTGDNDHLHQAQVRIRECGFEPIVVRESKDLRTRRANALKELRLLEKPKGCDIAIATRMVADAAANLFDCCFLFTTDVDFLPAVEAVRRMGKVVWVFGYKDGLSSRSPYLHVPDRFVDLGRYLENLWANHEEEIAQELSR